MDSKSQLTVDIIAKVADGKIDIVNAAKLLNKSRRTIERYLQRYREEGIRFVVHRNSGSRPANKISDKLKHQVQSLIKKKYFDLNLVHLGEISGVSRDTIYRHRVPGQPASWVASGIESPQKAMPD